LQLSKILRIKVWRSVDAALATAKAPRINLGAEGAKAEKAASGHADTTP